MIESEDAPSYLIEISIRFFSGVSVAATVRVHTFGGAIEAVQDPQVQKRYIEMMGKLAEAHRSDYYVEFKASPR